MKKIYNLFFLLLFAGSLFAQEVPDWMLTDIDGNSHHLYEVLDEGKVAIIDFSATWCGPCWTAHTSGVLEEVYEQHGPEGTDKAMVYFLECDPDTNEDCLHGLSTCVGGTLGDWVTGTKYPIIDLTAAESALVQQYGVTGYPTILLINPIDKKAYKNLWDPQFGTEWIGGMIDLFGPPEPGADLHMLESTLPTSTCSEVAGTVSVLNVKMDEFTNPEFAVSVNGSVVNTITYDGVVAAKEIFTLDISGITLTEDMNTVTVEFTGTDDDATNNVWETEITKVPNADQVINIEFTTDQYTTSDPTEFFIYDGNGTEIFSSGALPPSAAYSEKIIVDDLGCYTIAFVDGYGDGLLNQDIFIYDGSGSTIYSGPFDGFNLDINDNIDFYNTIENLDVVESVNLAPNPVQDELLINVTSQEAFTGDIVVIDQLGKVVMTTNSVRFAANSSSTALDVTELTVGVYHVQILANNKGITKKFVKI